jgi:hypothetical protein
MEAAMIANESYGEVALGVESAWPALIAMPSLAVVPLPQIDSARRPAHANRAAGTWMVRIEGGHPRNGGFRQGG